MTDETKPVRACSASPAEGDERAAFEAWASRGFYYLQRSDANPERYHAWLTNALWNGWQARAALSNVQPKSTADDFETWWASSGFTKFKDTALAGFEAGRRSAQAPAPAHGGPHLRKQAARLLAQLADNRPRRAPDLDATRQLLEVIAAPANADKLIADLTRNAWEWGVSCEIDDVRWGEAGDSHNQMWRDKTAEAVSRLQAALLTATPSPAVGDCADLLEALVLMEDAQARIDSLPMFPTTYATEAARFKLFDARQAARAAIAARSHVPVQHKEGA